MTTNKNAIAACFNALGSSAFPLLTVVCILTLSETPIVAQEGGTDKSGAAKSSAAKSLTPQEWKAAVAHYNEAVELQESGFYDQAIAEYQFAIAIDARMFQAWSNLAAVYMEQKNFSKAIKCFEKAVSIDPKPNRSEQWRAYANALWAVHRKAEAIEKGRHAVELNPSDSDAARDLGSMLKDAGRSEEAQEVLEKASQSTKDGGGILESAASVALQEADKPSTDMLSTETLSTDTPKSSADKPNAVTRSTVMRSTDQSYVNKLSTDKLISTLLSTGKPSVNKPSTDKLSTDKIISTLLSTGKPSADKVSTANADKPSADKPGADMPSTGKSSTGKSLTPVKWKDAVAHYNKAVEFQQTGYYNHAITEYRAALAVYDRMWQAWSNLAVVYMTQKSFSKAIECFEKGLLVDPKPNRSEEWTKYATALWAVHRKSEAIEKCRHAVELNPSDSIAARNLAFMLKETGRFEDSQAVLDKASRFTKDGAEVLEPLEPGS